MLCPPKQGHELAFGTVWHIQAMYFPGVDCDFQALSSSLDEVMHLCADHGAKEHNMKGFGPDLYRTMRGCVKTLEAGPSGPTS